MTNILSYSEMQQMFEQFQKNLPQDSFTRYHREYTFTKSLIEFAKKQGLEDDVFQYQQIQKKDIEELKKLGYNYE